MQVEETTREREERLKGWSTFLDGGKQPSNTAKPAEGGTTTTTTTTTEPTEPSKKTEPEQQPETEPQRQQQEQEADSTDSSLAGSDDEEA